MTKQADRFHCLFMSLLHNGVVAAAALAAAAGVLRSCMTARAAHSKQQQDRPKEGG
jgi:hypothetical protein